MRNLCLGIEKGLGIIHNGPALEQVFCVSRFIPHHSIANLSGPGVAKAEILAK
jgi:hypothetical protein